MTTAIVHHRRHWMPTLSLLLAGGAAVLGLIAVASDDVGATTPTPTLPVLAVPAPNDTIPTDAPAQTVPEAAPAASVADESTMQLTEHVITDFDSVEVVLSLPQGWNGDELAVATEMDGREVYIGAWDVTHVYSDPCEWTGTLEGVGPTVGDLAAALEQQPMRDATVSDVEVDGFAGKRVRMSVPDDIDFADCDGGRFMSWSYPNGQNARYHQGPGQRDDVYILDVNGTRVVIGVAYYPDLPQADLDELQSIVQSLRINELSVDVAEADVCGRQIRDPGPC
jgi:hypothetical protein